MDYRQSRPWMDVILPLYSVGLILAYYRPQVVPPTLEEKFLDGMFAWILWGIVGALGGILALSALFLVFYLLYSPVYLLENAKRILDHQSWVDRHEVRFYAGCFLILVFLLTLTIINHDAALVSFTLLSGSAHFLWRILI